jgi:predicted kinase
MARKITMLIGPSCSGKSTLAAEMAKQKNTYIVSRDVERLSLFGEYRMGDAKEEAIITEINDEKVLRLLQKKKNVIIDNTHLKQSYIEEVIEKFNYLADIEIHIMDDVETNTLLARNDIREMKTGKSIPDVVIHKHQKQFKALKPTILQTSYPKTRPDFLYNDNPHGLPNAYIFDIDGTLAHSPTRPMWDPTDEEIMEDEGYKATCEIVRALIKKGVHIIYLTGRSKKHEDITKKWIYEEICAQSNIELYMRREGDYRSDVVSKGRQYEKHIEGKWNILGVFEDRKTMIEMWQKRGIFVFDVGQGKNYF